MSAEICLECYATETICWLCIEKKYKTVALKKCQEWCHLSYTTLSIYKFMIFLTTYITPYIRIIHQNEWRENYCN